MNELGPTSADGNRAAAADPATAPKQLVALMHEHPDAMATNPSFRLMVAHDPGLLLAASGLAIASVATEPGAGDIAAIVQSHALDAHPEAGSIREYMALWGAQSSNRHARLRPCTVQLNESPEGGLCTNAATKLRAAYLLSRRFGVQESTVSHGDPDGEHAGTSGTFLPDLVRKLDLRTHRERDRIFMHFAPFGASATVDIGCFAVERINQFKSGEQWSRLIARHRDSEDAWDFAEIDHCRNGWEERVESFVAMLNHEGLAPSQDDCVVISTTESNAFARPGSADFIERSLEHQCQNFDADSFEGLESSVDLAAAFQILFDWEEGLLGMLESGTLDSALQPSSFARASDLARRLMADFRPRVCETIPGFCDKYPEFGILVGGDRSFVIEFADSATGWGKPLYSKFAHSRTVLEVLADR